MKKYVCTFGVAAVALVSATTALASPNNASWNFQSGAWTSKTLTVPNGDTSGYISMKPTYEDVFELWIKYPALSPDFHTSGDQTIPGGSYTRLTEGDGSGDDFYIYDDGKDWISNPSGIGY